MAEEMHCGRGKEILQVERFNQGWEMCGGDERVNQE